MIQKITLIAITAIGLMASDVAAQSSRLAGRHTKRFNTSWEPSDTATYVYPSNHGGEYYEVTNQKLNYDTSYNVAWNGSAYVYYRKYVKTFNVQGKCTQRLELQINGTTETNERRAVYTLDGNGNVLEELNQDWVSNAWVNTNHILATYDGNNNMLTQTVEYGTNWSTSYLTVFGYDGNNNMTSTVGATYNSGSGQYDSTYRNEQFFNTNNDVDSTHSFTWSSGWQPTGRHYNYYDINGVVTGYFQQSWDNVNSVWVNGSRNFVQFNTSNVPVGDSTQLWVSYLNDWRNYYVYKFAYDMNNNGIEALYQEWDTTNNVFVNNYVDSMAYNSNNKRVWDKRQKWDVTTQTWVGSYAFTDNIYYYETYTADVKTLGQSAGDLVLFPSPARNNINISMQWNKVQDFVVAIYDMQGRLVRQWGEKATAEYKKNVLLNGLSSGTYILKIRGKDATVQEQFVIMD